MHGVGGRRISANEPDHGAILVHADGEVAGHEHVRGRTRTAFHVSLSFGNVAVEVKSAPLVETVTNNQSVALNITGISTGGGDFTQTNTCQQPLSPGGSCTIDVYFTPSTMGTRTGKLTITDDASNSPQTVALGGIGASSSGINISPTSLVFGSQVINTSSAGQKITVNNSGTVNITVNSVAASGGFSKTDTCTGVTLTPGQSCTITASFGPVVTGPFSGAITINDTSAGAPHVVTMSGTGMLAVSMSANLTFPATNVGTTSPTQNMTLTNNQSQALSFTFTTSGDYTAVGNGSNPCNGTLAAKGKCTFGVTFKPTYNGQIKGALTVSHNASGSPTSGGLTGTGQNGPAVPLTFSPVELELRERGDRFLDFQDTHHQECDHGDHNPYEHHGQRLFHGERGWYESVQRSALGRQDVHGYGHVQAPGGR